MTLEIPRNFVNGLSDVNLDPAPPKPVEKVWSAVVPIDAVVHVAGFLGIQRKSLGSYFTGREMPITEDQIVDLAAKMADMKDVYHGQLDGTMRATRSDLLLLREIKRHISSLDISERETELFQRSYRDIIKPFRKEFQRNRTPSNTRVWLEVLNPFNGLSTMENHPE